MESRYDLPVLGTYCATDERQEAMLIPARDHSHRAKWPSICWVYFGLIAVSCATTPRSTDVATPPVPAVGTWRNVTQVFDVPPGDLRVTLREDGTGVLEMPAIAAEGEFDVELASKYWIYDEFTWTRQHLDGRADVLSLRGEGTKEPTEMRLALTFSNSTNVLVQFLVEGETPDGEPKSPNGESWAWVFRRD